MKERLFTAVYEKEGDWYVARADELRGAYGQGATIEEARQSLREAIILVLEEKATIANERQGSEPVLPEEISIAIA
ncbi:MAG: type II toxin-antitoxin system HicB family antitoxin [Dehalococcoidia bacterium]